MIPRGLSGNTFRTRSQSFSSLTLPVPSVSTFTLTGSLTPIA